MQNVHGDGGGDTRQRRRGGVGGDGNLRRGGSRANRWWTVGEILEAHLGRIGGAWVGLGRVTA